VTTNTLLLLNRSLGFAAPEDYVTWAVERLCDGDDGQALCILAGLNLTFDRDEVERYFQQSCEELGIDVPAQPDIPRNAAVFVWQGYEQRELSSETALDMMAALYSQSEYSDPLLAIWFYIQENLSLRGSGYEGCFYPPESLDDLDALFEREWHLYRRAAALDLPNGFLSYTQCLACGHVGEPSWKQRSLLDGIKARLSDRKPARWASCPACGSFDYRGMTDPKVRDDYFTKIEGEHAGEQGGESPPGAKASRPGS